VDTALGEQRERLRETQRARREKYERQQALEDKVMAALQGRTTTALHGAKDLYAFVKRNGEVADYTAKNLQSFSSLFGQETGTTNDALLGFSSACKSMQKLYSDFNQQLVTVELPKTQEALAAVDEGVKKVMGTGTTVVSDQQSAREKLNKAIQAQERAWEESEAHARNKTAPQSADADPWLSGLRCQAAAKGLDKVEGEHASDLRRLVQELRAIDCKRLEVMKSTLRSYAEAHRDLLSKALQNAEEFAKMVERIEPEADCHEFLTTSGVSEDDLLFKPPEGEEEKSAEDLGVWIPDDAVRTCTACDSSFGLMKRKHHCRRCGHVFCDKCSSNTAILPPSFGLGQNAQRVCDGCYQLLQQGGEGGREEQGSLMTQALGFEILKEGTLVKKTTVMGKASGLIKNRFVVCTKAGFLHLFESKFDLLPKSSVNLHTARVMTVDDDACAMCIESEEVINTGVTFWRGKATKKKYLLRSPSGSLERDAWMKVMTSFNAAAAAPPAPTSPSAGVFSASP